MMRASVLIIAAAVATAACRDNPGFRLSGGQDDDGETGASGSGASSGVGETGDAVCAPVPDHPVVDAACGEQPSPATPPSLALSGLYDMEACGANAPITVKRTDDLLHACNSDDCSDCPENERAVGIGLASIYSQYEELLPAKGECARLWHLSGNVANTGEPCSSVAYALSDLDGRLRFAVSYGVADPFPGSDGPGITVKPSSPVPCSAAVFQAMNCGDKPAGTFNLDFTFGDCEILDAYHNNTWTEIVVESLRYQLDVFATYSCLGEDPVITWYLHRL